MRRRKNAEKSTSNENRYETVEECGARGGGGGGWICDGLVRRLVSRSRVRIGEIKYIKTKDVAVIIIVEYQMNKWQWEIYTNFPINNIDCEE